MPINNSREQRMDGIIHKIDTHGEALDIIVLADLHIGDAQCDVKLVQSLVDKVRDTPNLYAILAGDLMNNAILGSRSDVYTATMNPSDQLRYAVKLFEPIKNKILAVVPGNHEDRTSRTAGFDLTLAMCAELGISKVYCPETALVVVHTGQNGHGHPMIYTFYVAHGTGGGRKPGGKINRLSDYSSIIDADIYVVGHTHMPASYKDSTFKITGRGNAVLRERLYVNTAAALRYGGYGKRAAYTPTSTSYPIISLSTTHGDHRAYCTL